MNVSIVNRTPPVLQKGTKRPSANSGHNSSGSGNIVLQTHDHAGHPSGTGGAVDKKA